MPTDAPLLLTGAAGVLGRDLRPRLLQRFGRLRVADKVDPAPLAAGEEGVTADLADLGAVEAMVAGTSAILHFGAYSVEADWETILPANIIGTYNLFEASRRQGVRRVIFASTNHVIGFHPSYTRLDTDARQRPDGYYGVSKSFGEDLGSLYVDKYDLEVACLRIGSCLPRPSDVRHLSTWLSYDDLFRLILACLDAPRLGFTVAYGVSANSRAWWDNSKVATVHYRPQDNAEEYAAAILAKGDRRAPDDPGRRFMGGPFPAEGYVRR